MGRRTLIVFICMHLLVSCLRDTTGHIYYEFINNTGEVLEVLYPARYTYAVPFQSGDMYDLDKNDTTMSGAGLKAFFSRTNVYQFDKTTEDSGYTSIEEMAPYDTVRVFIYDASYQIYPGPGSQQIWESEKYYCRYDFTSKDLYQLMNEDGNIVICFPPDVTMKNVKMWPHYEDIRAAFAR